ncbi:MAG: hypothetical protein EXR72_07310 [Myxococcales bacterium]|nr:hypothetical protein [Myxococcales bacterium]
MTRLRWGLGAALTLLSLGTIRSALGTYVAHHLWLGAATVIVLGIIAVGGFASLAFARRRLGRELAGLSREPATGELIDGRRRRLEEIRRTGATPDLDALAQASAAEETGRAYIGRYLVAVTVLVGLVGTFAGLMETLRGVAPLLSEDQGATLKLIAAPLAGLDVTFGASIVGILVTLALALVQGDLVLAEELALARLEERTTHWLVPSLWPPADSAAERAARELAALRTELSGFLHASVDATSGKVAAAAATGIESLVREVKGLLAATVKESALAMQAAMAGLPAEFEKQLRPVLAKEGARIGELREAAASAMKSALAEVTRASAEVSATLEKSAAASAATHGQLITQAAEHTAAVRSGAQETATRAEAAFGRIGEAHAARLDAAVKSLIDLVAGRGEEIRDSASANAAHFDAVAATLQDVGAQIARTGERLLEQAAAQARALVGTGEAVGQRTEAALAQLAQAHAARLDATTRSLLASVDRSVAGTAKSFEGVAASLDRTAGQTAGGQQKLMEQAAAQAAALALAADAMAQRAEAIFTQLAQAHATRLDATVRSLLGAVERSVGEQGTKLEAAAGALAKAAADRSTVAGELGRLGDGLARLEALVKNAREGGG